jgi:ABC-type enterochelin transport system permease subunit
MQFDFSKRNTVLAIGVLAMFSLFIYYAISRQTVECLGLLITIGVLIGMIFKK